VKKNLLLSIIATIGTLIMIEFALQIASLVVFPVSGIPNTIQDDRLGWRPNPKHPEHDQKGFRNNSVPDQAIIIAIGDSQTYGTGVLPDQAWPQQLESLANMKVYNMAYGGYGPGHSLILWEEATDLKPKLIIEAFYSGNDATDAYKLVYHLEQIPDLRTTDTSEIEAIINTENIEPLAEKVKKLYRQDEAKEDATEYIFGLFEKLLTDYSKVYDLLRSTIRNYINKNGANISDDLRWARIQQDALEHKEYRVVFGNRDFRTVFTPSYRLAAVDLDDPRIAEGHRISLKAIQEMNKRAQVANIEFAVLLIPTKELVFKDIVYKESDDISETYRALIANEELFWQESKRFFQDQDIYFVDALPALREAIRKGNQPYQISHDGHPNPLGHRVIAQLVLSEIVEQE